FPLRGDDGEIRGICGMITEITARKQAEEALGIHRDRLSRAELISGFGHWEFDMTSKKALASAGARRIYGLADREWTIQEVQKMVLPEYREALDRALRDLREGNRPYDVEFKIRRLDTGEIVDIHSVAEYDRQRQVVFGVIQDITDRKHAEAALQLVSQRTQVLLRLGQMTEATLQEITDFCLEEAVRLTQSQIGYLAFLNEDESVLTMHSWSKSAMAECAIADKPIRYRLVDTGLWGEAVRQRRPIITNDYASPSSLQKGYPDGHVRILRHMNVPIFAGSRIVIVAGVGNKEEAYAETDVHLLTLLMQEMLRLIERKRAEEELVESRRKLEDIIAFLPDATLVVDHEGKVIAWNRAIEAMTGIRHEDMIGKGNYEYALPFYGERRPILIDYALHPDNQQEKKYTAVQRTGDILFGEAFAPGLPGGESHLSATASVLRDSKGQTIAAIECVRDHTERKRLEERLNRAEKMEGLGRLAGGVAHDLNNILGALVGYSELLGEKLPQDSPLRRYANHILKAGLRGAAIIQDLLTLARRGVAVSEVVDLNGIVSDYTRTPEFEKLISEHRDVKVCLDLTEGLLNIKGSPIHLSKSLANLVSNAAEAIPGGSGEIVIRTENRYLDIPIQGYDTMLEGEYAVLTVSDTGKGIPDKDLGKIFEPFYTRKIMGRSGTGLGLAVVWGTVKDHNGYIDVQSKEGKGSTFTLYLPVCREEVRQKGKSAVLDTYLGKGESILVVDDVEEQRELALQMLERLGYKADAVSSGEEAVDHLRRGSVDLIVLDMIMEPGIDGLETFRRVLEINPRQKAIMVSGFSETDRVREAQELGAGAFVRKPYVLEKIGIAIRKELDR
ncbi:MAG: GAF domain-containing protein, partial [Deltaproteobacteria bacterium]|nr:GAF domain-containing protein [Deltaproteobacteria bacterium]